jgi:hypothetical protein
MGPILPSVVECVCVWWGGGGNMSVRPKDWALLGLSLSPTWTFPEPSGSEVGSYSPDFMAKTRSQEALVSTLAKFTACF